MVTFSVISEGAEGAECGGVWFSLWSRDVNFAFSHVAGGGLRVLGPNLGSVREGGVRGGHGVISRPDRSSGKDIAELGSLCLRTFPRWGSTLFVFVYVLEGSSQAEDSLWFSAGPDNVKLPEGMGEAGSGSPCSGARVFLDIKRLDPSDTRLQSVREHSRALVEALGLVIGIKDGLGSHPTSSTPVESRGWDYYRRHLASLGVIAVGSPLLWLWRGGLRPPFAMGYSSLSVFRWETWGGNYRPQGLRAVGVDVSKSGRGSQEPSRGSPRGPILVPSKTTFGNLEGGFLCGEEGRPPGHRGRAGTGLFPERHGMRRHL